MVLQATSPLRTAEDITAAIQLGMRTNAEAVVSVCQTKHHPHWTKRLADDGRLLDSPLLDQPSNVLQDLPPVYALNGAIYFAKRSVLSVLLEYKSFYTPRTYAYLMPPERSLDIDTPWDLYLTQLVLSQKNCDEVRGSRKT